jgi:hypothetical protein
MSELVKDIGLVMLGAALKWLGDRLSEWWKLRNQKLEAFRRLDTLIAAVSAAVGHGHDFANKDDWHKELNDLANKDREWLGDLYESVKRISWRIRDHSFDHDQPDSTRYCCDELLTDLSLLQLAILKQVPMPKEQIAEKAEQLAYSVFLNTTGVGAFRSEGDREMAEVEREAVQSMLSDWRQGTLRVGEEYATSRFWRGGEQSAQPSTDSIQGREGRK